MVFSFSVAILVASRSISKHLAFAIFVGTTSLHATWRPRSRPGCTPLSTLDGFMALAVLSASRVNALGGAHRKLLTRTNRPKRPTPAESHPSTRQRRLMPRSRSSANSRARAERGSHCLGPNGVAQDPGGAVATGREKTERSVHETKALGKPAVWTNVESPGNFKFKELLFGQRASSGPYSHIAGSAGRYRTTGSAETDGGVIRKMEGNMDSGQSSSDKTQSQCRTSCGTARRPGRTQDRRAHRTPGN